MNTRPRVFLDSNVLFSASLDSPNNFVDYWNVSSIDILVSQYSIDEVSSNLKSPAHRANLWNLVYRSHLVPDGDDVLLDTAFSLPAKDQPILKSAIAGNADILVTGDRNHFGRYVGKRLQGVIILSPRKFRRKYLDHLKGGPRRA